MASTRGQKKKRLQSPKEQYVDQQLDSLHQRPFDLEDSDSMTEFGRKLNTLGHLPKSSEKVEKPLADHLVINVNPN